MKKLFIIFFLFSFNQLFAQSNNEIAIRRLLAAQTVAWNQGDIDGFMNGYWKNDSLMFIGKTGITYGWQNTLNNYKKGYPDTSSMGKLSFTIIKMIPLSTIYYQVVGKWQLRRSMGDLAGYFTLLFQEIDGHWVIIADHSS